MNAVFVNHLPPEAGVVGAVRLWRFAEELSSRGNRVLYVCGSSDGEVSVPDLAGHAWKHPLVLRIGPAIHGERRASSGGSGLAGKLRTAFDLLVHGGPFWRWRREAATRLPWIRDEFRPEVCIATFGNLDALNIARDVAQACGVPWVMDIKDPSDRFLPTGIGWLLKRRYRDAAGVTLNSEFQRRHNDGWAVPASKVIYSGVEDPRPMQIGSFSPGLYALVGALYSDEGAARLLSSILAWRSATRRDETRLIYMGSDGARLKHVAESLGAGTAIELLGQLPRLEFLRQCSRSAACIYLSSTSTFHHKTLELLVLGRPVIAFPGESVEALALAKEHGLPLWCADTQQAVSEALDRAPGFATQNTEVAATKLGWPHSAGQIEAELENATRRNRGN